MNETLNKSKYNPLGRGNHQTSIRAGMVNRIPINKYGGKYSMAGFAITKPKPKIIGTNNAINISLIFMFDLNQSVKFEYIFLLRITIKKYKIIT